MLVDNLLNNLPPINF